MARFHPFKDLPKELRDRIWDTAIRDECPAVHFFTLYDAQADPPSVVQPSKKVHATSASYVPEFYLGLAAPRCRGSDQLSWTDGNISTYLTDSGLWTACHESRERMLRYFRPSETSPQVSKLMPVDWRTVQEICNQPTASINMEFIRDNGERQYLTVRLSTDLLCLRLPENSNISWNSRHHWERIQDFPLFRWHSHSWHWESSYIMNVAVEYDPAWEKFHPRKDYGPFRGVTDGFSKVNEIHGLITFWFIDYRLRRKYKSDNCERKTFRAGKLTFIEVTSTDYEWCCCPKEGCLDGCFHGPGRRIESGAHALVYDLESYNESQPDELSGYDRLEVDTGADCRVLACVDLESEGELLTREEWYETNG